MSGSVVRGTRRRAYRVGIIRVGDWKPRHWSDVPESGTVVRVAATSDSRAAAVGWTFGFNSAALDEPGGEWAVILYGHGSAPA